MPSSAVVTHLAIIWAHQPVSKLTALMDAEPGVYKSFLFTATKPVSDSDDDDDDEEALDINVSRFDAIVALICSATSGITSSR